MKSKQHLLLQALATMFILASCNKVYYPIGVSYQSIGVKQEIGNIKTPPKDAKVALNVLVGYNGVVEVVVHNLTDSIMIVDKTMSFFKNSEGESVPYYDPTVRTSTVSTTNGSASGASVNLGGVARAAGVRGPAASLASAVTVGGGTSTATTNTNTTQYIDQPQIAITPHGSSDLGHNFEVTKISEMADNGVKVVNSMREQKVNYVSKSFTPENSYTRFSVVVSYSLDNGVSYEQISADFYGKDVMVSLVTEYGQLNDALRRIYQERNDVLTEHWFRMMFFYDFRKKKDSYDGTAYTKSHYQELYNYYIFK